MNPLTIHLIASAHLDPVWLWDWRDGLNEGITTCRSVLNSLEEFPELTFIRGEVAVYEHIEQHDPATFRRIQQMVRAGRWDIVGGTYIQPDTNLPATETLARHFLRGRRYFQEKFGKTVRVAWAADSFGHSAGIPEILHDVGIKGYVFSRPDSSQVKLARSAFWWVGPGGSRVMGYRVPVGWYGCEREELPGKLDQTVETAKKEGLDNIACFVGLGDHGGGPTRKHLLAIRDWTQRHPEVRVVYSGLHRLIDSLYQEVKRKGDNFLPTHQGEINFCLRGCYSSVAKFKFAYRQAEATVRRAERTAAILREPGDLRAAWDSVLFNSFHDILPGSSIERAYDDQLAWLGGGVHQSQRVELAAINKLAMQVNTTVPRVTSNHPTALPFLVWNPHPYPFQGHVELETSLDYRPLWNYTNRADEVPLEIRGPDNRPHVHQIIATENHALVNLPWRKRVVVPVTLPAWGWNVFSMGWVEGAKQPKRPAVRLPVTARRGASEIRLWNKLRLSLITTEDPWGSWGAMGEDKESLDLSQIRYRWKIAKVIPLESGPERSSVWVQLTGGKSRLELILSQYRGRAGVDIKARVLWNERSARLKLVISGAHAKKAEFDVPGGAVTRGPAGEVPGGRWVRFGRYGFASDALYNFLLKEGALQATICRAARYADDVPTTRDQTPWLPAVDAGELRFQFLLTPDTRELPRLAAELEMPPLVQTVPANPGPLPRRGSFGQLQPASLQVLAFKPAEDGRGYVLRVQETAGRSGTASFQWHGKKFKLGRVEARTVATWRLNAKNQTVKRISIGEN